EYPLNSTTHSSPSRPDSPCILSGLYGEMHLYGQKISALTLCHPGPSEQDADCHISLQDRRMHRAKREVRPSCRSCLHKKAKYASLSGMASQKIGAYQRKSACSEQAPFPVQASGTSFPDVNL